MKKISALGIALLSVALLILGGGCSDEDTNELKDIVAPRNQWCSRTVSYSKEGESSAVALNVFFYYTDTTVAKSTATGNCKVDLPAGLTMLVTTNSASNSVISNLTNNNYILKTFAKDTETTVDDGDTSSTAKKLTGSWSTWAAIYRTNTELRQNQISGTPALLQVGTNSTGLEWDTVKENFSWKRLLLTYLQQSL